MKIYAVRTRNFLIQGRGPGSAQVRTWAFLILEFRRVRVKRGMEFLT